MVDCVGKELNVGDKVICADCRYADLLIGEIVRLTPQRALVRYHRSEYGKRYTSEKLKQSYQIFKYVEVVRCKDCKHWCDSWVAPDGKHEHGYCHMEESDDVIVGRWDDDFCSYGERRTDD